ncbi:MAG: penicillin acylase family protein [Planctomycetaceae bacterium]|nr:penicillin acylase family protein [Planctomycetaceae bacterium]
MPPNSRELLCRLGNGEPIAAVRNAAGMSETEFNSWWQSELAARVPAVGGRHRCRIAASVEIERDARGIPHIFAGSDRDLYCGFGFAMAQDRLFQLDYLRRRGAGRLSEIIGRSQLELDLTARTVGLPQIAAREWEQLPEETRGLLQSFSDGVNAWIETTGDRLPIEFALLDYRPEAWRPQDCLVIAGEFRWYLTGRFPVICVPELAKRALGGDGPLYRAFLQAEDGDEAILPRGSYRPGRPTPAGSQGAGANIEDGSGSNNWVVAGARTTTGSPILASDPHIAFGAVSCWYQVRLRGGSFDVAGMAYAGMPAVMVGRNRRCAWGITNNICSVRDLYLEREDADHPGHFEFDGRLELPQVREEVFHVKHADPVTATIRASRNGSLVNGILPPAARNLGPVALRWQGSEYCEWLPAMQRLNRAKDVAEMHAAVRGWLVPTFCLVFADADGHIGYRATGELPLRGQIERGFREGWNPAHQWQGRIPYEGMPSTTDPERGFMATANNRVAAEDFPYPLSGTWASGHRALRIRTLISDTPKLSVADNMRMQQDVLSLRAAACAPDIARELQNSTDSALQAARQMFAAWDGRMDAALAAPAIFHVFFSRWSRRVVDERLPAAAAELSAPAIGGLATAMLAGDEVGWFKSSRSTALIDTMRATLDWLAGRLGPDMDTWTWGRLHVLTQRHFLSGVGELGLLLDRSGVGVSGDGFTVCNTGSEDDCLAALGAGYRMVADLSDPDGVLHAIDAGSESGIPGSPHFADQVADWLSGRYHTLTLGGPGSHHTRCALEPL